jgi:hypothetical protein
MEATMRRHTRSRRFPFQLFQLACVFLPFLVAPCAQASEGAEPERVEIWNLTYIRSHVSSTTPGAQPAAQQGAGMDNIDRLVQALDDSYRPGEKTDQKPVQHAVQRAGGGRLILRGTEKQLREMEHILTLVDAPWPQVQLDLWAVQVSGDDQHTAQEIQWMEERISESRDKMLLVQEELERLAGSSRVPDLPVEKMRNVSNDKAREMELASSRACVTLHALGRAGFEMPHAPLSLNEALVLLTLSPYRDSKVGRLQCFAKKVLSGEPASAARNLCNESSPTSTLCAVKY